MGSLKASIHKLHQETGLGLSECKHALEKSAGNYPQAVHYLQNQRVLQILPGDLDAVGVRLAIVCQTCNSLMAVNGPWKKVVCSRCASSQTLEGKFAWHTLLNFGNPGIDVFTWAVLHPERTSETGAFASIKLEAKHRWPHCPSCGKRLVQDKTRLLVKDNQSLICPHCEAAIPGMDVSFNIAKPFQYAVLLVGCTPDRKGMEAHSRGGGTAPIVLYCTACGAPLGDFGDKRSTACPFCKAQNYMPDSLWLTSRAFHKPEFWYILFDPELIHKQE